MYQISGNVSEKLIGIFTPTAEGYYDFLKNSYVFNYTDHLGNVRVSYEKDATTGCLKILEESNYYPFGLKHSPSAVVNAQPNYKYKYNGKELQDELGLNMYDYGWRNYDPAIGRLIKIDRFAEKYHKLTPYGYAGNNPVLINDIQGDSLWISLGKNEKVLYENGNLLSQGKDGKFSEYKGDQAKIDKKTGAIKGYKGFLGNAVSGLNTLSSKSAGNDLVTSIQESTSNVNIEQSSTGNRYDPNTNTVMFDPNSGNGDINARGSTSRPLFIGLGHEMAHGLDDINGTLNTSLVPGFSLIKEAEKFATHIENQLRNEHNLPLRTHYRASDSQGTVIESMQLLNGRINSAHYPNFYYGGLNSNISPAPAIINNAQIVPSVIINIQQ